MEKKKHDPGEKIKRVTEIFSSLELDRITAELADSHYEQALQFLDRVNAPSERKLPIAEAAKKLMARDK